MAGLSEAEIRARDERLFNAIENVLARLHRHDSPKPMMDVIRGRYLSPLFFIESNEYTLRRLGISRLDAFLFSIIPELTRMEKREAYGPRPRLNKLSLMSEYLIKLFIGIHVECSYIILLDARGYMISSVLVRKGTTDSTPFYLKEMLSIAVQNGAKAVVLCHNHPCGTRRPSQEDIYCTLRAMNAFMACGILLLDHVIIANRAAVSMRDCGSVPARLWEMQVPRSKLLREWLDVNSAEDE